MPTINIEIKNVTQIKNNISFTAISNNKVIKRTLNIDLVDNWNDFAQWLINQNPDFVLKPNKEQNLNIEFHTEIITDPELGEFSIKIVDNVIVT